MPRARFKSIVESLVFCGVRHGPFACGGSRASSDDFDTLPPVDITDSSQTNICAISTTVSLGKSLPIPAKDRGAGYKTSLPCQSSKCLAVNFLPRSPSMQKKHSSTSAPPASTLRSRLLSWVLLSPPSSTTPYTPLPSETTVFTSPPRISLAISIPSHYPAKQQQPFSLTHPSGTLYLTNRRIIYLPDKPTATLQSFAAPILNLHDSHVTAPFFGPNAWTALLQPVSGGGIPTPSGGVVELKLTFKDGGAFDFHTAYERVKESLVQAVEVSGMGEHGGRNTHVTAADLEDLPVYSEVSEQPLVSPIARTQEVEIPRVEPPIGLPPAYEAPAPSDELQGEVERRLGDEEREVWGGEGSERR